MNAASAEILIEFCCVPLAEIALPAAVVFWNA